MADEGAPDEYLSSLDFKSMGYGMITNETMERIVPPVSRFLMARTKQQLFDGAIERRILLFPVATLGDILENAQLAARGFFRSVELAQSDTKLTTLGPFALASAAPLKCGGKPPRLGEHNAQIYQLELGLARSDLVRLRNAGVI